MGTGRDVVAAPRRRGDARTPPQRAELLRFWRIAAKHLRLLRPALTKQEAKRLALNAARKRWGRRGRRRA